MFDIFLGIFSFLSPIFFLPKPIGNINALQFYQFGTIGFGGYNYLQLQFFQFGVIVLFIIAMFSKQQREFFDRKVAAILSIFLLTVYLHPISVKLFFNIFIGFLLYFIVVKYTKNYKRLFWVFFSVSILNTLFSILQFFGINLIYHSTGRIDGLMCLSTHLGVYQAMVLPICYALSPYLIIVPIIGIILSKSISAIIVAFLWLTITFRKKIFSCGIPPIVFYFSVIMLFLYKNYYLILQKIDIRLMVWKPVIAEISHKLFGKGIIPFNYVSPIGLFENPCSIYLQLFYYMGILAIIPIFLIIKNLFGSKNIAIVSSLVIALVLGIEKSIFDYPRLAGTIIVLFGFLIITKGEKNEQCVA